MFFKNQFVQGLAVATALVLGQACTDLDPEFTDSVSVQTEEGNFGGVADAGNALENLYNGLEGILSTQTDLYAIQEVAAENIAVLTRGVDWSDNGVWRELHNHTWDPGQQFILNAWNGNNSAILAATQLLDPNSNAPAPIFAQGQVIRAFHMWTILSNFGQVPFRGVNEGVDIDPQVLNPQQAFDFLMNDLNTAIASGDLTQAGPGDTEALFEFNQAAALWLRAQIMLNAGTVLGTTPAGAYQQVIDDVTAIEALGFVLDEVGAGESYFDIWDLNGGNSEGIYYVDSFAGTRMFNMIHPNQTGWNGFVVLTEVFDLLEPSDLRLGPDGSEVNGLGVGFIRGQQQDANGNPLNDRQGNALIYETIPLQSLEVNNERTGIRLVKYPQRGDDGFPSPDNNFLIARFSDALLMRAEAAFRLNGGGLADLNAVRVRAGATTLGSITMQDIIDERRRELAAEGTGRLDQVRFGTFAETWELKTVQDEFRSLFPIPANALATNPNLQQNPGY